jgi:hypothetical protein
MKREQRVGSIEEAIHGTDVEFNNLAERDN